MFFVCYCFIININIVFYSSSTYKLVVKRFRFISK